MCLKKSHSSLQIVTQEVFSEKRAPKLSGPEAFDLKCEKFRGSSDSTVFFYGVIAPHTLSREKSISLCAKVSSTGGKSLLGCFVLRQSQSLWGIFEFHIGIFSFLRQSLQYRKKL
eukprot:UN06929